MSWVTKLWNGALVSASVSGVVGGVRRMSSTVSAMRPAMSLTRFRSALRALAWPAAA